MASYGALVSGNQIRYAGIDQGIDFTGPGQVHALDNAQVTRVVRSGSGWPGEGAVLVYQLLAGPAKGRYVYVAEDFAPSPGLRVGSTVPKGGVLGQATGSGRAPGIEVGWASASGLPLAPRPAPRPAPQYTTAGASFESFVSALSGGSGGGGVGGAISDAGSAVAGAVTGLPGTIGGAAGHIPGVAQAESVGSFLGKLTDPAYLLRGLQVVAGGALVAMGLVLLARQVALANELPDPLQTVGGAAAGAVPAAAVE